MVNSPEVSTEAGCRILAENRMWFSIIPRRLARLVLPIVFSERAITFSALWISQTKYWIPQPVSKAAVQTSTRTDTTSEDESRVTTEFVN